MSPTINSDSNQFELIVNAENIDALLPVVNNLNYPDYIRAHIGEICYILSSYLFVFCFYIVFL